MTDNDAPGRVYTGTAGWHYDDWKGIVYPKPMPQGTHPLSLLCRWFDLVEINVTFYRAIPPQYCERWLNETSANPHFLFSAKVPGALTHEQDTMPNAAAAATFTESLAPLQAAGRLGAVLAQFPWRFKRTPENRQYLARLTDLLAGLPLVVEMRHNSWDCPQFHGGLRARGIAFCNIDQPPLHACIAPTSHITAPLGYVRLHGRNHEHWFKTDTGRDARYNYLYDQTELNPWITRILAMRQQINRLLVVTNNHYRGQAVVNALEIQAALGILRAPPPHTLRYTYPQISELHP